MSEPSAVRQHRIHGNHLNLPIAVVQASATPASKRAEIGHKPTFPRHGPMSEKPQKVLPLFCGHTRIGVIERWEVCDGENEAVQVL